MTILIAMILGACATFVLSFMLWVGWKLHEIYEDFRGKDKQ